MKRTFMSPEEIQEIRIRNREKVEKYAVIPVLFCLLVIIGINIYYSRIDCYIITIFSAMVLGLYTFMICSSFEEYKDRIYTKVPAILGFFLMILLNVFFAEMLPLDRNIGLAILFICFSSTPAWGFVYTLNMLSVKLLDYTIFSNPVRLYTAKITNKCQHKSNKNGICSYYIEFYDYENNLQSFSISKKSYDSWNVGDVIEASLQARINEVAVKRVVRMKNFSGKTEMEVVREKYLQDIAEFEEDSNLIKAISGQKEGYEVFKLSYLILPAIDLFMVVFVDKDFGDFPDLFSNVLSILFGLVVTCYLLRREYNDITKNYTLNDLAIWKDFLVPKIQLFFGSAFFLCEYLCYPFI